MPWYIVYETDTGKEVSSGSSVADTLAPGLAFKEYASRPVGRKWDPSVKDLVDYTPPPKPKEYTTRQFLALFDQGERMKIYKSKDEDVVAWRQLLADAGGLAIPSDEADEGLSMLVVKGLITDARKQEILDG